MLYGRRVIEKSPAHERRKPAWLRPIHFVDSTFQWKYTLYFVVTFLGASAIFLGPVWFMTQQNYDVFIRIAYDTHPQLVQHLEREVEWLTYFICLTGGFMFFFCMFIGLKMTESIVGPLISVERHLKKISAGDWSSTGFKIRSTDDFKDFANSYAYFYKSLRANAEAELAELQKLAIDPQNREALSAWTYLVKRKQQQLGIKAVVEPNVAIVSETSQSPAKRHAS